MFDSTALDLYKYKNDNEIMYVETSEGVNNFVEDLLSEVTRRKQGLEEALRKGEVLFPKDYYCSLSDWSVYIDDADEFIEKIKGIPNATTLLNDASGTGIRIISTASATKLKGFDDLTKYFKNTTYGAVLGSQGTANIFPLNNMRDIPSFGYGVLFNNGVVKKVKLPKFIGFQEDK